MIFITDIRLQVVTQLTIISTASGFGLPGHAKVPTDKSG